MKVAKTDIADAGNADVRTVAIDARTLCKIGQGVSRFLAETLAQLAHQPGLRFVLISNRPLHPDYSLPFEVVIDTRWGRAPGSLWMLLRFNTLARRVGADIVWGPAHVLPLKHKSMHSVLTVHDLVHRIMPETMGFWNRFAHRLLMEPSIRRASHIVADTHTTRSDLLALTKPGNRNIDVIYLGVSRNFSGENWPRSASKSNRGDYLMSIGSIEPRKNIGGLVSCVEALRKLQPELTLRLTGAHSWGAKEALNAIDQSGFCIRLGFVSDAELAHQIANSQAFVMPSHYEGFGLPIIEAVGLAPIILSDIPVFRELSQYIDGLHFVDFSDPEAAAKNIAGYLGGDPSPAKFKNGFAGQFSWKATAETYAKIFLTEFTDPL